MKNLIPIFLWAFISLSGHSQEKKNYKPVLKELNKMLHHAEEFSWMYEPAFEIVQPYKVSNDTLSVIIRGMCNDKPVTHKYEAPLSDLSDYIWDVYYVLQFNSESVKISELTKNKWAVIEQRSYFHLGKLSDNKSGDWSKNFRKILNELYRIKNEFEFMD